MKNIVIKNLMFSFLSTLVLLVSSLSPPLCLGVSWWMWPRVPLSVTTLLRATYHTQTPMRKVKGKEEERHERQRTYPRQGQHSKKSHTAHRLGDALLLSLRLLASFCAKVAAQNGETTVFEPVWASPSQRVFLLFGFGISLDLLGILTKVNLLTPLHPSRCSIQDSQQIFIVKRNVIHVSDCSGLLHIMPGVALLQHGVVNFAHWPSM